MIIGLLSNLSLHSQLSEVSISDTNDFCFHLSVEQYFECVPMIIQAAITFFDIFYIFSWIVKEAKWEETPKWESTCYENSTVSIVTNERDLEYQYSLIFGDLFQEIGSGESFRR